MTSNIYISINNRVYKIIDERYKTMLITMGIEKTIKYIAERMKPILILNSNIRNTNYFDKIKK